MNGDNNQSDKKQTISGIIWRFLEQCGAQGVTLIVSIVLARLLGPEENGTIALVLVFTNIMLVFINSSFSNALIQKKNADDIDFSSVFYVNFAVCIITYLLMFAAAPLIANFYERPELIDIIRTLSFVLIIAGIKSIQQAYVSKYMLFRKFFFATISGTVIAAIVGIVMAMNGFGVWALVAQQLVNQLVGTLVLWKVVPWRPKRVFSFSRVQILFSFGWKILVSSLIDTLYNDLRQLVIGKLYTSNDLAFYNKGKQFPQLAMTNISTSIDSVLLPTLSRVQDDVDRLKTMTRRSIKVSTYILMPIMVGLAACADSFVLLILTEKWMPCVPYLRVFCIVYAFHPIHTANLNAIKALGRSDLFLKMEICKKAIGLAALFLTMQISVAAMAYSMIFTTITSQLINSWPNKKLMNYSYIEQLRDLMPAGLMALFMGTVVYLLTYLGLSPLTTLFLQILFGIGIYIAGSWVFKIDSFEYLLNTIKTIKKTN